MFFTLFLMCMDYYFKNNHDIVILHGVFILLCKSIKNLIQLKLNFYDIQTINLNYNMIEYYSYDLLHQLIYNKQWMYIFHHIISILLLILENEYKTANNIIINANVFLLESSGFCLTLSPYLPVCIKNKCRYYYFITRVILLNNFISYYIFIQNEFTLFFIFQLTILITLYTGSLYAFFNFDKI